jgi:hypothetical protein
MDQFRQSINGWERRHRKVHHAARHEYHSMMLQAAPLEGGGGHRDHCSMSPRDRCARDVEAKKNKDNCTRRPKEERCRLTKMERKARAKARGSTPRDKGEADWFTVQTLSGTDQAVIRKGQRVREKATRRA